MSQVHTAVSCLLTLYILSSISISSGKNIVFYESFTENFRDGSSWIVSQSPEYTGEWKHSAPEDSQDFGLLVSEKAKKYGIAAELPTPVDPKTDTLILQYDLRLQNGIECGGAYLKFLMPQAAGWSADQLQDSSPYSIMFGPDKCGSTNKVHFIFRHKSPVSGEYVEHHLKKPPTPIIDSLSHVYTAVVYPNNTVKVLVDGEEKRSADLLSAEDFDPPVLLPATIPDKDDVKPEDWDERAKIPDSSAVKPEDWDEAAPRMVEDLEAEKPKGWLEEEPEEIDDPEASRPEDWDESEDGEWEASKIPNPACESAPGCGPWKRPLKRNPAYKGKWTPPLIDNPAYKGIWKPREIPNPLYFHLDRPNLEPVAAVGIEIWTMNDGILFDNILVTDDELAAATYRSTTWRPKFEREREASKAKKAEEEEKLKEVEEKTKTGGEKGFKEVVFDTLYKLAYLPILSPVKSHLLTALDKLESKDEYAYATIAALMVLLIAVIYVILPGKKEKPKAKKVTVEEAKKEDISVPDDEPEESKDVGENDEGEGQNEEEESKKEDVAEAEKSLLDEIEEETETNVRRRTRRQA